MTAWAYYNENNAAAAYVLRAQIKNGVIAPGDVDERSVKDVSPDDLRGFTQCHFFAGGGLWSVAARMAGWPDSKPFWSGSCPCQGESLAGKRLGADDPRHLWPDFYRIIRARRPAVVVGEQVAAAAGTHWLDGVSVDMAREDYAFRVVDLPACALDAPHQRQRLYWIAVDDDDDPRLERQRGDVDGRRRRSVPARSTSPADDELFIQPHAGGRGRAGRPQNAQRRSIFGTTPKRPFDDVPNGSFWSDYEWIVSPVDGKARRAKPGVSFLVDGLPGRVDLWRIGGNAIVPQIAAEVLRAYLDTLDA